MNLRIVHGPHGHTIIHSSLTAQGFHIGRLLIFLNRRCLCFFKKKKQMPAEWHWDFMVWVLGTFPRHGVQWWWRCWPEEYLTNFCCFLSLQKRRWFFLLLLILAHSLHVKHLFLQSADACFPSLGMGYIEALLQNCECIQKSGFRHCESSCMFCIWIVQVKYMMTAWESFHWSDFALPFGRQHRPWLYQ